MEEAPPSAIIPRSRRDFLANVVLSIGTVLGLGSLAYRFLEYLYPLIPPVKLIEVAAGSEADIAPEGVRLVELAQGPLFLEKKGEEVFALSAICTHLGCTVGWHPEQKCFICPCHQGIYDLSGAVLSGPPPRPLEKLPVKVRDGQVFVLMNSLKEEEL